MQNHQKIIDEISFTLQSDVAEVTDEIRELATQYGRLSREVNDRLRKCGEYLRQGLRSEAIQLAEHEPDLLDVVAVVDFPERDEWVAFLAQNGVKTPDPLLSEVAEQLNEAYAAEEPLQRLMVQHRTLALSLAPLPRRLGVMRQLRELDPMSNFWEEDIRTFENVRLQEIVSAADKAAKARNSKALQDLSEELRETPWFIKPNKKVWALVEQHGKQAFASRAMDRLSEISNELNDAFQSLDLGQARRLRGQWNQLAEKIELSYEDPLYDSVGPVLDWIADEDEREEKERTFTNATGRLERALAGRGQLEELEQLANAIQRTGHAMPEILSTRYANRVSALSLAQTRRRRGLIGAGVLGLLLTIALIAGTVHQQSVAAHAQQVSDTFQKLVSDGHIEQARDLLDREPEFTKSAAGMKCETQLAGLEKAERERLSAFDQHMESARHTQEFGAASAALGRANSLARTEAETAAVSQLTDEVAEKHRLNMQKAEATFRDAISKASSSISGLEDASMAGEPLGDQLEDVMKHIAAANVAGAGLRPELSNQLRLLKSRVESVKKRERLEKSKQEVLTRLTNLSAFALTGRLAVATTTAYTEALKSFADDFPDDTRTESFKRALKESHYWLTSAEWHQQRGEWQSPTADSKREIAKRLQLIESFLATQPPVADQPQIKEYKEYLDALGRRLNVSRNEDDETVLDRLSKLFSDPLVSTVQSLESKDGAMYFFSESVDFEGKNQRSFKHLVGFLGETRPKIFLTKDFKTSKSSASPQVAMATAIRRKLAVLQPADWDSFFLETADTIRRTFDVDPILRLILMKRLLETASQGSYPLAKVLAPRIENIERSGLNLGAAWMDPEREGRDGEERLAKEMLSTFDNLDEDWKKAESWNEQYRDRFSQKWLIIGWLDQTENRRWRCRTDWEPDGDYILYVIGSINAGERYGRFEIGSVVNGKMSITTAEQSLLLQGRPVIAVPLITDIQVNKQ